MKTSSNRSKPSIDPGPGSFAGPRGKGRWFVHGVTLYCLLLAWAPNTDAQIVLPPVTHTVGPGGGPPCDFSSIQAAIDAAATGDIIRVTTGINWLVASSLTIANKSLTLVGGYSDCEDTTSDPDQPSTVSGLGFVSTLTVSRNIAGVQNVLVRNFTLRMGEGGNDKGGGVDLSGAVVLRLDNVRVQENEADYGGGIRIHGGPPIPTLRLEGGSLIGGIDAFVIHNNAFQNGGGIFCDNGGIIEWLDASINFNTALNGGGISMNDCTLTMPAASGSELRAVEIRGNQALTNGGGIHALNSSELNISSAGNRQVRISNNKADGGNGGGVFLLGSDLFAKGVQIEENTAGDTGGGVHMSGSSLELDRGDSGGANCPERERCATLYRNHADGQGGAVYLFGASVADLRQVFVDRNTANDMPGMLVSIGASLIMRDVQLSANNARLANTELIFASASTLDFRHVSAAFNDVDQVIRTIDGTNVKIHDSILWQPGLDTLVGDGSAILDLSCNNAVEDVTLPGAAMHPPGFLTGEKLTERRPVLRLAPDSQNVDACDNNPGPSPDSDALGLPRVVDNPEVADQSGPLDRGALEFQPPIFEDGFEDP